MLPFAFALNVAGTVVIEDRTEVRGRVVRGPRIDDKTKLPRTEADGTFKKNDEKSAVVMDLETDPTARIRGESKGNALTLAYSPRIVVANFGNAGQALDGSTTLDFIHRPLLTGELQIDPRNRFVVNGLVQFGTTTAGTLLLPNRWNGEDRPDIPRAFPVLPFARQSFLSIYAAAGYQHTLSPRTTLTVSAFYITFGQPTDAGRIAAGGSTYLQNPGLNIELEHKLSPTSTLLFNMAPQVNIVQATPIQTNNDNVQLAADGQPLYEGNPDTPDETDARIRQARDATGNVIRNPDGTAQQVRPLYISRTAPNTYQLLLEVRWRKQTAPLTLFELAAGANVLYQNMPRAIVPDVLRDSQGKPIKNPDNTFTPTKITIDNPFGLLGLTPETTASSRVDLNLLPVGEALISHGFVSGAAQGKLIAFTRADAWLNTVSGEIGARSATVAALNFDFGLDAIRAQAAFVKSLPLSARTTEFAQVITEVSYERELARSWFFDVGARLGFQDAVTFKNRENDALSQRSQFLQPGAFVGVAWRPLPAKL